MAGTDRTRLAGTCSSAVPAAFTGNAGGVRRIDRRPASTPEIYLISHVRPCRVGGGLAIEVCSGVDQSGTELIATVPGKTVVHRGAEHGMPESVASIPFLEEAHLQSAIQRVEQYRNSHRRL